MVYSVCFWFRIFNGSPHSSESVEFDRMENFERGTDPAWVIDKFHFAGITAPAYLRKLAVFDAGVAWVRGFTQGS
jgi:hypothetical protein